MLIHKDSHIRNHGLTGATLTVEQRETSIEFWSEHALAF